MPNPTAGPDWMRDNSPWLNNYPINQILVFPGSHDAGMYKMNYSTSQATSDQVVTQTQSVYGQLECGARWFDIRPYWYNGDFYCGHGSKLFNPLGWQGGIGQSIDSVIDDVNRFTQNHKELIILRISHHGDWHREGDDLNVDQQTQLMKKLINGLHNLYRSPNGEDVASARLDKFVGTDRSVILMTRTSFVYPGQNFSEDGSVIDGNVLSSLGWNVTDVKIKCITNCHTQDDIEGFVTSQTGKIIFGILGLKPPDLSVIAAAWRLRQQTFPRLPTNLLSLTEGRLDTAGAIIQVDNVCDDSLLNICLAVSQAHWKTRMFGMFEGHHPMIAYAGRIVNNGDTHREFTSKCERREGFRMDNAFMRDDPWVGHGKTGVVLYSSKRGDSLCWDGQYATENDWLSRDSFYVVAPLGKA